MVYPVLRIGGHSITDHIFRWNGQRNGPIFNSTLAALQTHCPLLQTVTIYYPCNSDSLMPTNEQPFDDLIPRFASQDVSGFKNLKKLVLLHIYGDLGTQGDRLALALLASPLLTFLHLSLRMNVGLLAGQENFFKTLCETYKVAADKKGLGPLSLKTLILGYGVSLLKPPRVQDAGDKALYLCGLTNLRFLEEIVIDNSVNYSDDTVHPPRVSGIAWSTFTRALCPNLTRAWIGRYDEEVQKWFAEDLSVGLLEDLVIHMLKVDTCQMFDLFNAKLKALQDEQNRDKSVLPIPAQNLRELDLLHIDVRRIDRELEIFSRIGEITSLRRLSFKTSKNIFIPTVSLQPPLSCRSQKKKKR
jgi:hypothetical protein